MNSHSEMNLSKAQSVFVANLLTGPLPVRLAAVLNISCL